MSKGWSVPPSDAKPDKTKPARLYYDEGASQLTLEFYDTQGRAYRIPVMGIVLPPEIQELSEALGLGDLFPTVTQRNTPLAFRPAFGYFDRTGSWSWSSDTLSAGGMFYSSSAINATLRFRFRGKKVGIIFDAGPDRGIAGISIDNGPEELFDTYSPNRVERVWFKDGLPSGEHVIAIRVTGTRNSASSNTIIAVHGLLADASENPHYPFDIHARRILDLIHDRAILINNNTSSVYTAVNDLRNRGILPNYSLLTTTTLGANQSFISSWFDASNHGYAYIHILAMSDVDGTLYVDFSDNQTNFTSISTSTTNGVAMLSNRVYGRYIRVRYVNGSTAQSRFSLSWRWSTA